MERVTICGVLCLLVLLCAPGATRAQETVDALAGVPFREGDVIGMEQAEALRDYLPEPFWENREFFLYEGMRIVVIHPFNTRGLGYPYNGDYSFGPYGFSYANDVWELRRAFVVRFVPRNEDHPYSHKDIWIDWQTYEPLYSFAYDRKGELWKIIWHNFRWSEDWRGQHPDRIDPATSDGHWAPAWKGVPDVRDLRMVSQIIVNVQTGTGNRIEVFSNTGTPPSNKGKVRKLIDIGRLNRGR